jgi:hypothetical protein
MAESQGEFAIERIAHAENGHEQEDPADARDANGSNADQESNDAPTLAANVSRSDAYPDSLRRRYYIVVEERGKGVARFYADERGEYLAFKLVEDRLTTRLTAPEVVRDMIAIAEHRKWTALRVRGSDEFRRQAWLEASGRGIIVQGYEPTALDREALARRYDPRQHDEAPRARRRNSAGKRLSVDRANVDGRPTNKVTSIDPAKRPFERRETTPDEWRSRSTRFRNADRGAAVRDGDLVGAQSQLAIIEKALERAFPKDPRARERILAVAKERIAEHLEQGRTFSRATIQEQMSHSNERKRDNDARVREDIREKTRQRER